MNAAMPQQPEPLQAQVDQAFGKARRARAQSARDHGRARRARGAARAARAARANVWLAREARELGAQNLFWGDGVEPSRVAGHLDRARQRLAGFHEQLVRDREPPASVARGDRRRAATSSRFSRTTSTSSAKRKRSCATSGSSSARGRSRARARRGDAVGRWRRGRSPVAQVSRSGARRGAAVRRHLPADRHSVAGGGRSHRGARAPRRADSRAAAVAAAAAGRRSARSSARKSSNRRSRRPSKSRSRSRPSSLCRPSLRLRSRPARAYRTSRRGQRARQSGILAFRETFAAAANRPAAALGTDARITSGGDSAVGRRERAHGHDAGAGLERRHQHRRRSAAASAAAGDGGGGGAVSRASRGRRVAARSATVAAAAAAARSAARGLERRRGPHRRRDPDRVRPLQGGALSALQPRAAQRSDAARPDGAASSRSSRMAPCRSSSCNRRT